MEARIVKNWLHAIPIRILLPVVLTVALFLGTIFLLILPILQDRMMNDKREMIRELTETAWSVLDGYRKMEIIGQMSPANARGRAVENSGDCATDPSRRTISGSTTCIRIAREFILAFEPGGRITYVNRAWREASGFDTDEMLAMTIFEIIPLDEKPTFQDRLDLLYSGGSALTFSRPA